MNMDKFTYFHQMDGDTIYFPIQADPSYHEKTHQVKNQYSDLLSENTDLNTASHDEIPIASTILNQEDICFDSLN